MMLGARRAEKEVHAPAGSLCVTDSLAKLGDRTEAVQYRFRGKRNESAVP
jgi:hypothetical protein